VPRPESGDSAFPTGLTDKIVTHGVVLSNPLRSRVLCGSGEPPEDNPSATIALDATQFARR
jgi:hypothetical protein